jgi:diguanylate cyclase (GGDEF)-like protein
VDAAVFDALPMAVGRVDGNGRLLAANAAWRRLFDEVEGAAGGPRRGGDYLGACDAAAAAGDVAAGGIAEGLRAVLDGRAESVSREYYRVRGGQACWFRVDLRALPAGGAVVVHTDVTQHHRALDAAHAAARLDPLTGISNRRAFLELLQRRLQHGARRPGALLVVDLDGFKAVNDRYGHAAGDLLLCALARRLRHALRPHDQVARMGGDEFLVLIDSLPADQPLAPVVQRLRRVLEQPVAVGAERVDVGASIGALRLEGAVGDVHTAVVEADRRMYLDKRARRTRPAVVDGPLARARSRS